MTMQDAFLVHKLFRIDAQNEKNGISSVFFGKKLMLIKKKKVFL